VAEDAAPGLLDVRFKESVLPASFAVYDRVDYVKVMPESALASFSDAKHSAGYQQFEAIGYQRGADGRPHTSDDINLGPADVTWSIQVFYEGANTNAERVGSIDQSGLFTPAPISPKANFDVWAVATMRSEVDANGEPLTAKAYVVVTVPMYVLNGRQYVRDLDRWVDDGPAPVTQGGQQ
jgi:quinohemoprotein amine dehydrogenase